MKYIADHDLHIHTRLSSCSKNPRQAPELILEYARENGYKRICLTDHYWDELIGGASELYKNQNFAHISSILPLPKSEDIDYLFGCEGDIRRDMTLGIPKERFDRFDMMVIPTTHLHMKGFTVSNDGSESCEQRARLWCDRLDGVLGMDLPFGKIGIAHLACLLIDKRSIEHYLNTLSLIPKDETVRLFERAAKLGVGIELNADDLRLCENHGDAVIRIFRTAKECGCKFYLGSDAHDPEDFIGVKKIFSDAIEALGLTEDDKFIPTR